jgi:hypothetical protein
VKYMKSILIKDTTKEERIAIIREWIPDSQHSDKYSYRSAFFIAL